MIIHAFITHKVSELFSGCQDRFGVNADTKSIAVSDGMGATWQQKIWAQLLVETFVNNIDWQPNTDTIKPLCKKWREKVEESIQLLKERLKEDLPQKEKNIINSLIIRNKNNLALRYSAGATFVGIRFDNNKWNGIVLGDSCLIQWDGNEAKFHTSQEIEAFDSYPDYFDSDELKKGKGTPKEIKGILSDNEYLLLVSDPFSDFLFGHKKQGDIAQYIQQLLDLSSHTEFENLVTEWRKEGMHDDDTTLIIVKNDNSDVFNIEAQDDINTLIVTEDNERKSQENIAKETESNEQTITESTCVSNSTDKKCFIEELLKILGFNSKSKKKRTIKPNDIKQAIDNLCMKYNIVKKQPS